MASALKLSSPSRISPRASAPVISSSLLRMPSTSTCCIKYANEQNNAPCNAMCDTSVPTKDGLTAGHDPFRKRRHKARLLSHATLRVPWSTPAVPPASKARFGSVHHLRSVCVKFTFNWWAVIAVIFSDSDSERCSSLLVLVVVACA